MSLAIKIVTTANITRQFYQSNDLTAKATIERLVGLSPVFASSSLVISSDIQTEVFAPQRMAIIELETDSSQSNSLPASDMQIIALDNEQHIFAYDIEPTTGQRFKVDFYFVGGFVLNSEVILLNSEVSVADRTRRISQIFEQQIIFYQTSNGGIGILNPLAMTRAVITPRSVILPNDAIIVDDY